MMMLIMLFFLNIFFLNFCLFLICTTFFIQKKKQKTLNLKSKKVARKLAMVEADLERAEQRAEEGES